VTSSPTGTLFYQIQRTDSSPMAYGGSVFDFYNRDDRPEWARVRDELEDWYSHYPDCDGELRKRFRKRGHGQHFGACWELYMFTFYRRLGYEIVVHPTLPNYDTEPDFLGQPPRLHPRTRHRPRGNPATERRPDPHTDRKVVAKVERRRRHR
jgi:hypothetical protein